MQITTWNVNGLRALLRKGVWEDLEAIQADAICLQEIKARPDQLTDEQHQLFEGCQAQWNPAERPGYSGVLTLTKAPPVDTSNDFGIERFDVEGRVIQTRFDDFLLFNVYFPNGKSSQERLDYKLDFYDQFLHYCDRLHEKGEHIVVCGDVNTAHHEIDLAHPKANEKISGFLPIEREWLDKYLEHGFVDAFRALYPEIVQYTWWSLRSAARERDVGWRLDYFYVSEGLMPQVKDVVTHDQVMGSDHCPVSLILA